MEELFAGSHGAPQLIALLIVVLTCRLLFDVGKVWFDRSERKDELTDSAVKSLTEALQKNTASVIRLDQRIHEIEHQMNDLPKIKTENRRMIKFLSGTRWPEVKKAASDDGLD